MLVGLIAAPAFGAESSGATASGDAALSVATTGRQPAPPSLEEVAVALAEDLQAVPLDPTATRVCAPSDLYVSWDEPGPGYEVGAYVEPLGPEPAVDTTRVNGVVLCHGSTFAYMGFEASAIEGEWMVNDVPFFGDDTAHNLDADPILTDTTVPVPEAPTPAAPAPAPAPAAPAAPVPAVGWNTPPADGIEPLAAYEPQRACEPTAKPGTLALRNLLTSTYQGSGNLGITRACSVGGTSEHKEGRAFDWAVNVNNPAQRAMAESFIERLFATDAQGNPYALVRRMGVMYLVWNEHIWSSYRASEGWRPYNGSSPHTDHVHISLSKAGAAGTTSFWSGKVDPDAIGAPSGGGGGGGGGAPRTPRSTEPRAPRPPSTPGTPGSGTRPPRTTTTRPPRTTTSRPPTTTRPPRSTTTRPPRTTTTRPPRPTTTTRPRRTTTTTVPPSPPTTPSPPPTTTVPAPTTAPAPPTTVTTIPPAPTTTISPSG